MHLQKNKNKEAHSASPSRASKDPLVFWAKLSLWQAIHHRHSKTLSLSFSLLRAALQIWGAHVLLFVCHPLSCECPLICVRRRGTHTYHFYSSAITEDVPVPEERDTLHYGKVRRKGALFTTRAWLSCQQFVLDWPCPFAELLKSAVN